MQRDKAMDRLDQVLAEQQQRQLAKDELRVFIGFDSQEPVTFAVALHSLLKHASRPITVTPLLQPALRHAGLYTRQRGPTEATEFSLTRFLAPHLSHFEGYSLFLDSDVLVQGDVWELLLYPIVQPGKAVYVAQHDYVPRDLVKFDGHEQTTYPKKNWSSVMLFANEQCRALTPEYVSHATGLDLHRFHWTADEQVGALPLDWNWLVGEYEPKPDAKILHYTRGAPCFEAYADCDQADRWWAAYREMLKPAQATERALQMRPSKSVGSLLYVNDALAAEIQPIDEAAIQAIMRGGGR